MSNLSLRVHQRFTTQVLLRIKSDNAFLILTLITPCSMKAQREKALITRREGMRCQLVLIVAISEPAKKPIRTWSRRLNLANSRTMLPRTLPPFMP